MISQNYDFSKLCNCLLSQLDSGKINSCDSLIASLKQERNEFEQQKTSVAFIPFKKTSIVGEYQHQLNQFIYLLESCSVTNINKNQLSKILNHIKPILVKLNQLGEFDTKIFIKC